MRHLLKTSFFALLFLLLVPTLAFAHPGGTDDDGGHTCHTNCGDWGLEDEEYHYHGPDTISPTARMVTPFVSTRISKTTTFKVKWSVTDPSLSSGIESVRVYYRPSGSSKWRLWKTATASGEANFTGKAGVTYYFRTLAVDNAHNWDWSKTYKTIVPFNEGIYQFRTGFDGYAKSGKSQNYLTSVRYSYTASNDIVYKLYNNNAVGLIVTKGPNMGQAMVFVDGNYVKTVDAFSSKTKARQLIYYKGFTKKDTHWLWIVNLGTPGRARFEVDAVVVGR